LATQNVFLIKQALYQILCLCFYLGFIQHPSAAARKPTVVAQALSVSQQVTAATAKWKTNKLINIRLDKTGGIIM